jgi:hypothetical protein
MMLIVYLGGRSAWSALRRFWDRQQHPSYPINNLGTLPSRRLRPERRSRPLIAGKTKQFDGRCTTREARSHVAAVGRPG